MTADPRDPQGEIGDGSLDADADLASDANGDSDDADDDAR